MKQLIASICLLTLTLTGFTQSEKFTAAMKKNLATMDSAFKDQSGLLGLANNFERIGTAEKTQWLPFYFAAFCQVNVAFKEQDKTKVDAIADKAEALINKADSLAPDNSEISCIKSMIASCRLMVNPMQRYMEYGQESAAHLEAAMKQDPANPRPYFLKGQGMKYTPEQFGGGCKTAKPFLQTASEKYATFKPASDIAPDWGKALTDKLLEDCK